jgi:hypothetical protein
MASGRRQYKMRSRRGAAAQARLVGLTAVTGSAGISGPDQPAGRGETQVFYEKERRKGEGGGWEEAS